MSKSEILELDDETVNAAIFTPNAPNLALRIFSFLAENQNIVTSNSNGMRQQITGLDKYKLEGIARRLYHIDLSKWLYPLSLFESNLLRYQNNEE